MFRSAATVSTRLGPWAMSSAAWMFTQYETASEARRDMSFVGHL